MTSAQAQAILDYCPIDGASIADWFKRRKTNDLNRIAQAVQRGAIEELSVDEVAANVWNACNVSRNSARTVARTIINGVSNAARAETLFANEDAIDGIEFLATLDARTSHICGALDGTVWRGDEMKHARRPPLHPNCRSTLIPVVDLIDPETGEKIEETAERPAQNADGTYSQVAAKTTFKDYFESQPETFQREWLGEKRFELWKSGKLKFEDLAKPATSYRATPADLMPPTEKAKETAVSDDKTSNAQEPKIDRATLPDFDGSPKQNRWAEDLRTKALDDFEAADVSDFIAKSVAPIRSKPSSSDTPEQTERRNLNALIRAEIDKRGEAAVLADLVAATREIAAEIFANPSARDWIDSRYDASVLHRATTAAIRRIATTGSAAKPKPAFDLPPLDLPPLSGSPRQISWAEDLRRRAVRDLTTERANETARDALRRYRNKESAFAEEFRSDLEAAIKAVGGDEAAELILGREIFLDARGYVESFDRARDWINLHVADKKTLLEAAEFHVAGNPQNVAEILRRYAADAKAQAPQADATRPVVGERREPLFKGAARFGDRDAFAKFLSESTKKERKEALGKELEFAYNTRQLNDDEVFDALTQGKTADDLQRVGVYVGHDAFPVKNPKRPTPEEIAANRKREEDEHVRPLLAFWGRTLGPEGPREKNVILPDNFDEREKFTGEPNSSAEYYQDGKIKYRLYYDAAGRLEYVDDFSHRNLENHGGPHRHVFFGRARSHSIDIKAMQ